MTVGHSLIWSSCSLGPSAARQLSEPLDLCQSYLAVRRCWSIASALQNYIYMHLLRRSLFKLKVPLNSRVYSFFIMSSQQEQAAVQAASDAYVAAHLRGIALWDRCNSSMSLNYTLIVSFGRHNGCVRVLANNPISSYSLRQPANAVGRSAVHMAKEVEAGASALLACAIRNDNVHLGTDYRSFFKLYISSGMILSWLLLMHIYDIVIAVSQEHLLDTEIYSVLGRAVRWLTSSMFFSSQLLSASKVRHNFSSAIKW